MGCGCYGIKDSVLPKINKYKKIKQTLIKKGYPNISSFPDEIFEFNSSKIKNNNIFRDIILNEINHYSNINEKKRINLNILLYDENLKTKDENKDISAFFEMNVNGTFYGCYNIELFKKVCEKIRRNNTEFILISSGDSADKVFDYCLNMDEIREYYIYCSDKNKYKYLIDKYSKLKGIYNKFSNLREKLYNIKEIKIDNVSSSNLIYFEDYSRIYIKLHYEFIRKYSLYKLLKKENIEESEFLKFIAKEFTYYLDLANQLFPDKNEIINFFVENTNESRTTIEEVFNNDDNLLDDNIKTYIHNYTKESFYYKYLNKFLREGNFDAFRILSSHVAKFIYKLYDYRNKNIKKQKRSDLYRKMYLNPNEIKQYEESVGKVICYPSFTSTSLGKDKYTPHKYNMDDELVLLIIKQNKTKSVVSISEFSPYPNEEEYLFLPFSFFKIKKVEIQNGNTDNPHKIHLIALNSEKPIEEMFDDFTSTETDNLNPEGLDLLQLDNDGTEIVFNEMFFPKNGGCNCDCILL